MRGCLFVVRLCPPTRTCSGGTTDLIWSLWYKSSLVTPTGARMPTAHPTPSPSCWWQRLTFVGHFAARRERSHPPSFLETRCGHGTKFWVIVCEWKCPERPMSAGKGLFCFLCQFCQDDRSFRSYFSKWGDLENGNHSSKAEKQKDLEGQIIWGSCRTSLILPHFLCI